MVCLSCQDCLLHSDINDIITYLSKSVVTSSSYCTYYVPRVRYDQGSRPKEKRTGTLAFMASAGARVYNGSGGGAPSGVQGQSPWSGRQGAKPPEVESILKCRLQIFAVKFDENPTISTLLFFLVQLYSYRSSVVELSHCSTLYTVL